MLDTPTFTYNFKIALLKAAYAEAMGKSGRDNNGIVTPLEFRVKVAGIAIDTGVTTYSLAQEILGVDAPRVEVSKVTTRLNGWILTFNKISQGAQPAAVKFVSKPVSTQEVKGLCPLETKIRSLVSVKDSLFAEMGKIESQILAIDEKLDTLKKAKELTKEV